MRIKKKLVRLDLTIYEAGLIMKLRRHPFGKFEIVKQAGEPRQYRIVGATENIEEVEILKILANEGYLDDGVLTQ